MASFDPRNGAADRPLVIAAGLADSWTITLRDALGEPATGLDDGLALAAIAWPGDDAAALEWSAAAEWLDAAGPTITLSLSVPTGTAAGTYRARLTVAGRLAWEEALEVRASPVAGDPLPVYHTFAEQLDATPWVEGLAGTSSWAGLEELRALAREDLDELAQARDRNAGVGASEYGAFAGGWYAVQGGGLRRSETLGAWLDADRLVVTPDVRRWLCHHVAGAVARRQIGPGKESDYKALADYHEGERDRLGGMLLLGVDTSTPADGLADYWINCGEIRVVRG